MQLQKMRKIVDGLNLAERRVFRGLLGACLGSVIVVALILGLGVGRPVSAQTLYGSLVGTVTDPSGARIRAASITIVNTLTGVTTTVQSNEDGVYSANTLQPGVYTVKIVSPGFQPTESREIRIAENTSQRLNGSLSLASTTMDVEVTDAPPPLETEKADVAYEITSEMADNLPTTSTTGRNFQSLYQLVPGAVPPAEMNSASGNPQRSQSTNVNGAPNIANVTRIDGAINSYQWVPYVIAYVPSQEAIQSANFTTNSFTAEQGLAGGAAVNVIIKSGTNKFHGSLFEYNQSTPYNALPWLYSSLVAPPKNMFNEFGGSLGGPILRNKLFFFANFDRFTQRKTLSGYYTILDKTSALAGGDFSSTGTTIYDPATGNADGTGRTAFAGNIVPVSSVAKQMIALLPTPNFPSSSGVSNFFARENYSFDRYHADFKVNYNPNQKSSYFGRYSESPATIDDPEILGAAGGPTADNGQPGLAQSRIQNVGLGFTYVLTSSFFVDANMGYTRQKIQYANTDLDVNYGSDVLKIPGTNGGSNRNYGGIPIFSFATGYTALGDTTNSSPGLFRDNQESGNVNATWLKRKHSFRFGGELAHFAINHFQPQGTYSARGGFFFTGAVTSLKGGKASNMYNNMADFMLGLPQNLGKATEIQDPNALRFSSYAAYAQDKFQATRRLTLTYGIRYELYPFATRDHSGVYRYDPLTGGVFIGGRGGVPKNTGEDTGWGMFVPRFGANFRVNDKMVARTGFGMTVDPDNFRYLRDSYPAVILQQYNGATSYNAAGCLNSGSYAPLGGCPTLGVPAATMPNFNAGVLPLPAAVTTNTVPQSFRRGYLYNYNVAIENQLPWHFVSSATYVGMREVRAVSPVNINAGTVGGGAASRPLNILHGQTADVSSEMPFGSVNYNGLQLRVTNNFRRHAQVGWNYTWSHTIDVSDNSTYGSVIFGDPSYYKRNRATAGYDRKHNLQVWSVLSSPFGTGQNWGQKGFAAWVLGGWRLNTTVSKVSGTPMTITASATSLNAPGSTQVADQVKSSVTINGVHSPGHYYFDSTAFAPVTTVRYGTSARNTIRGPGYFRADAGIFRELPVWRGATFRFGAEAFDLTNTPVFSNPNLNASSSTLGQVTSAAVNRTLRLSGRITF